MAEHLDLEALRRLRFMKRCECMPRRGDHDYGLGGPPCPNCYGGDVIDTPAILAALERAERVEAALVAVREQECDEDWFPEDRPVSLVHLAHLQEPNSDCVLCACETGETTGG